MRPSRYVISPRRSREIRQTGVLPPGPMSQNLSASFSPVASSTMASARHKARILQ